MHLFLLALRALNTENESDFSFNFETFDVIFLNIAHDGNGLP